VRIFIEAIPFHHMRYATAGDWLSNGEGGMLIQVSKLGDWRMERLIAIHELIEMTLCEARGIAEPDVKAFDEAHPDADDPGSLDDAPYHKEHVFAEAVEKWVSTELGVDWNDYEARVKALFE
jgi:hypothetical protein